jgi:MFS family permease
VQVTEFRSFGARFWAFLAGEAFSAIGSWASLVAIWGYAAYTFDASPLDIGIVGVAWLLPPVFFGPVAGTVIDRLGPRKVLVAAKVLGTAASIALIFAHSFHILILFSFGHGISMAFAQPALDAFPPRIVKDRQLAAANSLLNTAGHLALVLGPMAAAGSIALVGFKGAFIFDAITYIVGIASTFVITMHPAAMAERTGAWRETMDGLRIALRRGPVRTTLSLTASVYCLYGTALMLEPLYVRDVLGRPVQTFALLQSAFGVFLVGTGFFVAHLGDRVATRAVLALAVTGSALGAIWYLGTTSIVMAFAGVMAWGAATAFIAGPSRTLLQRHAPTGAQGRVLAVDRTVEGIAHLVAMPIAAGLAAAVGIRGAAVIVGAVIATFGLTDRLRARSAKGPGFDQPAPATEPALADA